MIGNGKVGVVGAGMMGSEIALVFAMAGRDVVIADREAALAEKAKERIAGVLEKGAGRGFWSAEDAAGALSRLTPAADYEAFADRALVVEAVFEDEEVKAEVYRRLDPILARDCIVASNTSSIAISVLASFFPEARRGRFLGTHFFSPVSRMKLVEVIPGLDTDPAIVDAVVAEMEAIGKAPVRVKDVVGFAVNRLLHIFWIEATRLVEEGAISPRDLDTACKLGLGHPVGPFELMDGVTNDLTLDVQEILHEAYGERFLPRPLLKQMVKAGRSGRRAGRGWYAYENGKRRED